MERVEQGDWLAKSVDDLRREFRQATAANKE